MTKKRPLKTVDSPLGPLHLSARSEGLTHLSFADSEASPPLGDSSPEAARILDEAARQLGEYFAGHRREFEIPLSPGGTEFQRAVWRGLRDIPYGATISYGELARRLERPGAARAVGAANGRNPIPIILPCHRVIGEDHRLTGYGGGLPRKEQLLELEGLTVRDGRLL